MANKILRYLETIIESKSILAASHRLYISQPSLSQFVKRVEEDYQITIFNRENTPWTLTEEGEILLESQRKMVEIERECRQKFADRRELRTGEVRIASTAYRTAMLLNPVIAKFKSENPGIFIRIIEGNTAEVITMVESGQADCGIVISTLVPESLDHKMIYSEEVLIGLPGNHPYALEHPKPERRFDLLPLRYISETPFIIMKSGQAFHEYFYELCRNNETNVPVALEAQSIMTVPALIASGIGAALIPSTIVDDCLERGIAIYRPEPQIQRNNVSIAWKHSRYQSYATRHFIERTLELLNNPKKS